MSWVRAGGGDVARHPNWPNHQLVADWLAYEWRVQALRAASTPAAPEPPLPPPRHAPRTADVFCVSPYTDLDARQESAAAVPVGSGGWRFGEDAPGKSGWLVDAPSGAALTFEVQVPLEDPVVGVGFLASWNESMGSIVATLDGAEARLDALRPNSTASQTEYERPGRTSKQAAAPPRPRRGYSVEDEHRAAGTRGSAPSTGTRRCSRAAA